jgi:hypothetical protein
MCEHRPYSTWLLRKPRRLAMLTAETTVILMGETPTLLSQRQSAAYGWQ